MTDIAAHLELTQLQQLVVKAVWIQALLNKELEVLLNEGKEGHKFPILDLGAKLFTQFPMFNIEKMIQNKENGNWSW